MKIEFDHPAIVSGTTDQGRPRHDLVRVVSQFELSEIESSAAPVTFEYDPMGSSFPYTVRTHEGRHYVERHGAGGADALKHDTFIHRELIAGAPKDFEPMWKTVKKEATRVSSQIGNQVNNLTRAVTRREMGRGIEGQTAKACLSVALMKKQRWHSPDVESDVDRWRSLTAEMLSNVVMIDGKVHVRCFEPCLVLETNMGKVATAIASRGVYQSQVHKKEYRLDGLLVMGENGGHCLSHYFGPNELGKLGDMAKSIGWKTKFRGMIDAKDESQMSADYFEMETVRTARMLHEFGASYGYYAQRYGQEELGASFLSASEEVKSRLIEWQDGECSAMSVEAAAAPLIELVSEARAIEGARYAPRPDDMQRRIEHHRIREEMEDVSLDIALPKFG